MEIKPDDLVTRNYILKDPAFSTVQTVRKILESPNQPSSRKVGLLLKYAIGNPRLLVAIRDMQYAEAHIDEAQKNGTGNLKGHSLWPIVAEQLEASSKKALHKAKKTPKKARKPAKVPEMPMKAMRRLRRSKTRRQAR